VGIEWCAGVGTEEGTGVGTGLSTGGYTEENVGSSL
jgi:hypothetical protein